MAQLNTTELDFDQIKTNLINYFNRDSGPFKDYDFTGSGLNNLIDVLAYNTHYNAITAHMAMNESFLDSAQVRSNVVSRAKLLNYTPTSKTGATASINVVFTRASGESISSYTMVKGTKFNATLDGTTYVFQTTADYTATRDAATNTFTFNNVVVKQGVSKIQTFTIDNSYDQRFIINDVNIDTSTLVVRVYDSLNASNYDIYNKFTTFNALDATSKVYFLSENSQGNYEFQFGNGTTGKKPIAAGKVEAIFLTTKGPDANGANAFTYAETGENEVEISSVATLSAAASGADLETIDSIKFNAPLSFISQDRAVTSNDYKALIKANISGIQDVVSWGGEEEDPQEVGKVLIAVKPQGADLLTDLQKTEILNLLDNKKIVGITPKIVDPNYTYLYFELRFRYNLSLTNLTVSELSSKLRKEIEKFNIANLNDFDGIFRYSNLLSALDNTDDAILSNDVNVFTYKKVNITAGSGDTQAVNFEFPFAGTIDQPQSMISTPTTYKRNTFDVQLADEPYDNEKRKIYSFRAGSTGTTIIRIDNDLGFIYPETGQVALSALNPDAAKTIEIAVQPRQRDVFAARRNILQTDLTKTSITGVNDLGASNSGQTTTSAGY